MDFQTIYKPHLYRGEMNDGTLYVQPNAAMSPKEILRRFVHDMPVQETSVASPFSIDDLDQDPLPMQSGEYDPVEMIDTLRAQVDNKNQLTQ